MNLYQIIVPIISLIFIADAYTNFKKGKRRISVFLLWIAFWSSLSAVAIFPRLSYFVAHIVGFQDNVNAIIFIGIGILFYLIFRVLLYAETLNEKINRLVRNNTLLQLNEYQSKDGD